VLLAAKAVNIVAAWSSHSPSLSRTSLISTAEKLLSLPLSFLLLLFLLLLLLDTAKIITTTAESSKTR